MNLYLEQLWQRSNALQSKLDEVGCDGFEDYKKETVLMLVELMDALKKSDEASEALIHTISTSQRDEGILMSIMETVQHLNHEPV